MIGRAEDQSDPLVAEIGEVVRLGVQVAVVIGKPKPGEPVYARLHSACLTGDLFGSLKCDCGDQLRGTVKFMAENGGGLLLYLDQEGRGTGIANKIRAYRLQHAGYNTFEADGILGFDHDQRHFDFAADMLKQLGYTRIKLLTNNPFKVTSLQEAGLAWSDVDALYDCGDVGVMGGLLGILMMIPLRRALIVKEHGNLPYPEGTACADVLVAVGELAGTIAAAAERNGLHDVQRAADGGEALVRLRQLLRPGDTVLVKGSRALALDKLADALVRTEAPA